MAINVNMGSMFATSWLIEVSESFGEKSTTVVNLQTYGILLL